MNTELKKSVGDTNLKAYCSWCNKLSNHTWSGKTRQFRKIYTCDYCKNETVLCWANKCNHMSKAGLAYQKDHNLGFLKRGWEKIDNLYCSEHRHEVIGFEKGNYRVKFLNEIDYSKFQFEKSNYQKYTSIGIGIVGGALVMGPMYYVSAPALASFLGSHGLLGAASTGTQISTLSGAALKSASLAKVGFGALSINGLGMAGGTILIGGFGSALGGISGANVSADFFESVEDFEYVKLRDGGDKEIIFINGLFSQNNNEFKTWMDELEDFYGTANLTGLRWESYALSRLAGIDLDDLASLVKKIPKQVGEIMLRLTKFKNLISILGFLGLVNNIWFVTYYRAALTGYILADNIARLHKGSKIDLHGHSLGARVIFYALQALSTKDEVFVENVYLYGGAQERRDENGWINATKAVSGKIFNIYSSNDKVLKISYQAGTLGGAPIGLKPIETGSDKISNLDASDLINSHSDYHNNFKRILNEIIKIEKESSVSNESYFTGNAKLITIVLFLTLIIAVFILIFSQ